MNSYMNLGWIILLNSNTEELPISWKRSCNCDSSHTNCLTPKEWLKYQMGVWQFAYEHRDIRDKAKHPAVFPIALARRCIELFSHEGELILDPFVGSGTTLLAARDANRNAIGFDINANYIALAQERLNQPLLFGETKQIAVLADAHHIAKYIKSESVTSIITSPPYANLLNRKRQNKSLRSNVRKNDQYLKIEQYSQQAEDLGISSIEDYKKNIIEIFTSLLPLLKVKGHCIINIADIWSENKRITLHIILAEALRSAGYELRNIIIWDRMNIVNNVGIFGWPNNYITMGTTFEYILDFWRPY